MDIIKEIVPKELTTLLNDITSSKVVSYKIISIMYDAVHLAAVKFWDERYTKMIEKE